MPTVATDTDSFQATIQRPNNGELADSASLSQFVNPIVSRTRYNYNRSRSALYDVTRAPYSADPTGVVDATSAIQAAISAAFAAGGGDVCVPPGIYKRSILTLRSGVNLRGVGSASILRFTGGGATNGLVFIDNLLGPACEVSEIQFDSDAVNTGTPVVNNSGRNVIFRNCTWNKNSANLQGTIASIGTAGSEILFEDCHATLGADVDGFTVTQGKLVMRGGKIVMPGVYASSLVYVDTNGDADIATNFDCTGHTAGQGICNYVVSSSAKLALHDTKIDATGSLATVRGVGWVSGARVDTSNYRSLGNIDRYFINATAALGSNIDLIPSMAVDHFTAASITIPRGVRSYVLKSIATSGPTITLPTGLFPGQELLLTYNNASTSSVMPTFVTTPVDGTAIPTIGPGIIMTGIFVWESRDASGAYRWVQKGAWGFGIPLV